LCRNFISLKFLLAVMNF